MSKHTDSSQFQRDDYLNTRKFIRDPVHGYVYLTRFELHLIDTLEFQRLKDIRQLTSQHVYPSARHTRFEHSLGVLEMTRQAVKNINRNRFIADNPAEKEREILNSNLQFNAALAALLHDVGHCPFSHLGEGQFDEMEVWVRLCLEILSHAIPQEDYDAYINKWETESPWNDTTLYLTSLTASARDYHKVQMFVLTQSTDIPQSKDRLNTHPMEISALLDELQNINRNNLRKPGSRHEQMSCILILDNFYHALYNVGRADKQPADGEQLTVDFELLVRSIIGLKYKPVSEKNMAKNVVVDLINSDIFDMDKLDYIMRDSFFTGIGTPKIDTHRLFRNMYLDNGAEYKIIFTSRAIPALQNMIEARDQLYMYVYNHHAAVYSDYMISYIFRRLSHNYRDYLTVLRRSLPVDCIKQYYESPGDTAADDEGQEKASLAISDNTDVSEEIEELLSQDEFSSWLGIVQKQYLFSPYSIVRMNHSDSDLITLLNNIHRQINTRIQRWFDDEKRRHENGELSEPPQTPDMDSPDDNLPKPIEDELTAMLREDSEFVFGTIEGYTPEPESYCQLKRNVKRSYHLIDQYLRRHFLKPWWKTNSEFENFIRYHFRDDIVQERLCTWVCNKDSGTPPGPEFRSQLAKLVIYITSELYNKYGSGSGLCEGLRDGDFFVIERSNKFHGTENIRKLDIALKSNEILGSHEHEKHLTNDYYIRYLTNVIPQRPYYTMYEKNSFYIFSKPLDERGDISIHHYQAIEQIFTFVAESLVKSGSQKFIKDFCRNNGRRKEAYKQLLDGYITRFLPDFKQG